MTMKVTLSELRNTIFEIVSNKYMIRVGTEILVKRPNESSKKWRTYLTRKALYLTPDAVVSRPKGSHGGFWTFETRGWLVSVEPHQVIDLDGPWNVQPR